jgi:multidrug efflux pump subunit AcrB
MGLALGLAVVLIYVMLVGSPLVPPAVGGDGPDSARAGRCVPRHWLLGETFSAASMVGLIALAGVVVRNSLLLIDFARDYQRQGCALDDAVREAGAVRLRPILLTTLAIVLGTLVMVPDPMVGGIAISLIFGSVSSALLTLITVPLLYRGIARRLPGTGM